MQNMRSDLKFFGLIRIRRVFKLNWIVTIPNKAFRGCSVYKKKILNYLLFKIQA